MLKLTCLLTVALILGLVTSCAPPKTPAPAGTVQTTPTEEVASDVTTLDIRWPMAENWDADAEVDGIEFELTPKDAKDMTVKTAGIVSAKLWDQPWSSTKFEYVEGSLLQEWTRLQVSEDDYGWIGGVTLRLEYTNFEPAKDQYGIIKVTFATPDGRTFEAKEDMIRLAGW